MSSLPSHSEYFPKKISQHTYPLLERFSLQLQKKKKKKITLGPIGSFASAYRDKIRVPVFLLLFYLMLTLKAPNEIAADDILIFYFYLSKKIRLDFSCESSA